MNVRIMFAIVVLIPAVQDSDYEKHRREYLKASKEHTSLFTVLGLTAQKSSTGWQKEFEISKTQLQKLDPFVIKQFRLKQRINSIPDFQRKAEAERALSKEMETFLKDVFLPHQIKRIRQVALQIHRRGRGDEFDLVLAFEDELELTEEEKKKLNTAIKKARQEYKAGFEKIARRAARNIKKAISDDERKIVDQHIGKAWPIPYLESTKNAKR